MFDTDGGKNTSFRKAMLGVMLVLLGIGIGFCVIPKLVEQSVKPAMSEKTRIETEKLIRNYIVAHPEILPEAIGRLRERNDVQQLGELREKLEAPFPRTVLGNPNGSVILVQFTDYACGYCRQSVADVDALIASNPDLKVVVRELPVLGQPSVDAARLALAAAEQGRYATFHKAMFAAGPPTGLSTARAAAIAGVDLARAKEVAADDRITAELSRNGEYARKLKFSGTPSWIVGDQLFSGAVGLEGLAEAVEQARRSSHSSPSRMP